jgi:hypothetical protein
MLLDGVNHIAWLSKDVVVALHRPPRASASWLDR